MAIFIFCYYILGRSSTFVSVEIGIAHLLHSQCFICSYAFIDNIQILGFDWPFKSRVLSSALIYTKWKVEDTSPEWAGDSKSQKRMRYVSRSLSLTQLNRKSASAPP